MTLDTTTPDAQSLAATHRAMWALGDYALMAEEVTAPLGPMLVAAAGHWTGRSGSRRRRRLRQHLAAGRQNGCLVQQYLAGGAMEWEYLLLTAAKR